MAKTGSRLLRAGTIAAAAGMLLMGGIGAASAALQTDTIGAGTSGDLNNGVSWTSTERVLSDGSIRLARGIDEYPTSNTLTLSGATPTKVEFGVGSLQASSSEDRECVNLPVGTQVVTLSDDHTWNAAARTVCGKPGVLQNGGISTFEIVNPSSSLTFRSNGENLDRAQGIYDVRVTADVEDEEEIPMVAAPVAGAAAAAAAAGAVPLVLRKRRSSTSTSTEA